jgi:arsenite methyltransferase
VTASADHLSAIETESVDVVTTRSVLVYVDDKALAFRELFRVLRPGGRAALFEPIADRRLNDKTASWHRMMWEGYPAAGRAPVNDLLERLLAYYERHSQVNAAMVNFNERDLVRLCLEAGFAAARSELDLEVGPVPPGRWDAVVNSAPNPLVPPLREIMNEIFTDEERAHFERHMRPLVEGAEHLMWQQGSYTWAVKAPIPKDPRWEARPPEATLAKG